MTASIVSLPGLLLPAGVVQPFDLRRLHDDLHVMAFFDNHPVYEAVEAMIRRSVQGPAAIRAILTRHDQSQIDHVNDDGLLAAARFAKRQTCRREIALSERISNGCPRVTVAFVSHDGEAVVLDVTSATTPDRSRSGLSDPGRHAEGTNLPLMWRGRSALAGAQSRVTIAGIAWPIAPRLGDGTAGASHHGVLTESHDMLILRAGTVSSIPRERPAQWRPGEQWIDESSQGERGYRVVAVTAGGGIELARLDGAAETVHGRRIGDRWELRRVELGVAASGAARASLAFDGPQRFSLGLDGTNGSVVGEVARDADDGIHLLPHEPAWARTRAAHLRFARAGDRVEVTTTIG